MMITRTTNKDAKTSPIRNTDIVVQHLWNADVWNSGKNAQDVGGTTSLRGYVGINVDQHQRR